MKTIRRRVANPILTWEPAGPDQEYRVIVRNQDTGERRAIYDGFRAECRLPPDLRLTPDQLAFRVMARPIGESEERFVRIREYAPIARLGDDYSTPAADLLKDAPDGVFFSNGPGDPAALPYVVDNAKALADANVPVFGICLGHQVLAQALGAKTFKLKFGHRGTNHPVKHLESGAVEITSQNHGFAVDPETIPADVEITHVNLYDNTVEGLKHRTRPIFCVQYHPEAAPGPHDADYLFRQFLDAMEARA